MARTDTSLVGRAKELYVAQLLVEHGLYVFHPLVDNGFDLLASNNACSKHLMVQVRWQQSRTGFKLHTSEIKRYGRAGRDCVVIVFGSPANDHTRHGQQDFYFFPFETWLAKAQQGPLDRKDRQMVVTFKNHSTWIDSFKNEEGLLKAFSLLLDSSADAPASGVT